MASLILGVTAAATAPPSKPAENVDYKFMHCEKCFAEKKYDPKTIDKGCPNCKFSVRGNLIPTVEPFAKTGEIRPWKTFNLAIGTELFLTLGALVWILSNPPKKDPNEGYATFSCRYCGRHLRYRYEAAGQIGQCPKCKKPVLFPKEIIVIEEDDDDEDEDEYEEDDESEEVEEEPDEPVEGKKKK